ncbi:MAG: tetratricopeptide repeat protein [bacterium]
MAQSSTTSPLPKVGEISARVSQICLFLMIFLVPLFYLPWSTNVLEVNKQLILVTLSVLAGLTWLGSMLATKELYLRRSPINIVVIAFVLIYGLATWFSKGKALSFFGYDSNQYTSFLTVLALAVLYFLVANSARTINSARWLFGSFFASAFVVELLAILNLYGMTLPGFGAGNANTVGSIFSLGIFLAFNLLLICGLMLIDSKKHQGLIPLNKAGMWVKLFLVVSAILSLFVLIALDFWVVWVMLIVGALILLGFSIAYPQDFPDTTKFLMPLLALTIAILFLVIRTPLHFDIPTEVSPSLKSSWGIAKQALRDNPLLGSGPATYIYDYAKYRALDVNTTMFWNVRFDRANSHIMTLLATTGILGTVLFLVLLLSALIRGALFLIKTQENEKRHMTLMLYVAFAALVVSKFLYASNMALEFLFWFALGMLAVAVSDATAKKSFQEAPRMSLALSFCFVLLLVLGVGFVYLNGQHYVADYKFSKALKMDQLGKSDESINYLGAAAQLDTQNDAYFRNLSQAELLKINEVGNQVAKDDVEKQALARQVVELSSYAVNSALYAKNIAPLNVANISQLAFIYQNISPFTEGALDEALKQYEEAVRLEPNNPVYPTQIGRIYLAKYDDARQLSASKDETVATKAKADAAEFLGKAEDKFKAAIELKTDYAPAHYNLSLTFDRGGRLKDAIDKMEATVNLSPKDVGVYFQLGLLYYRDDQKDEAIKRLETALALAPNYSNAMWYLATIYEEKNDTKKAIELIKKVQALNPDDQLVQARLEKLQGGTKTTTNKLPEPIGDTVNNPEGGVTQTP